MENVKEELESIRRIKMMSTKVLNILALLWNIRWATFNNQGLIKYSNLYPSPWNYKTIKNVVGEYLMWWMFIMY